MEDMVQIKFHARKKTANIQWKLKFNSNSGWFELFGCSYSLTLLSKEQNNYYCIFRDNDVVVNQSN